MFCLVMAHETPHTAPSTTDAPPFPHHLAVAPTTLEGAERLNADPPADETAVAARGRRLQLTLTRVPSRSAARG